MLRKITIRTRLLIVLALIIVSVLALAYFAMASIEDMYNITSRIYEHPLNVSNASIEASRDMLKMHRDMKDVVLLIDENKREEVIREVDLLEKDVYTSLELIKTQILGAEGRMLANEAEVFFKNWKPIRDRVITLVLDGETDVAAKLTQGQGAEYVRDLEYRFQVLNQYARNKADEFIIEAEEAKKIARIKTILTFAITLFIMAGFIFLVIRTIVPDLNYVKTKLDEMVHGADLHEVEINGSNEITEMAKGFNQLVRNLKREIWVKDGLNILELILEKEYGIKEFADRSLEFLLKYTNADLGVFYEVDSTNKQLDILSYHSYLPLKRSTFFEYEDDFIQELLASKQGVFIELDQRYEKLEYSLNHHGQFISTYLYPLLREESVIGIIKLSSTKGFSEEKIEFMNLSASLIAADLMVVNRQEKIEKLLDQTNDMNEQLRNKSFDMEALYSETEMHKEELEMQTRELNSTIETLKETQEQLVQSEKLSSLATIVTGIAHEINTPLGVSHTTVTYMKELILTMKHDFDGDSMRKDRFEIFLKNLHESIDVVEENNRRSVELIKNFKEIAVDQTSGNYRQYNMKDYLVEIVGSLRVPLRLAKVETMINAPDDLVVDGYPGAMSQIMTNLIMNSIKHGFSKREYGRISIDVEEQGNKIVMFYKDDGKGIEEKNLKRVFDPFFTTQRGKGGSGLGLNIVYNLVTKNLKGTISVQNGELKGVEFIIEFPKLVRIS